MKTKSNEVDEAIVKNSTESPGEGTPGRRSRRGGRPRLPEPEQRRHKVTVSLNDEERRVVEGKAGRAGLPVAVYLRASGLEQRLSRRVNAQLYHQLARIGVNVNQMARRANQTGRLPEREQLEALAEALLAMRRVL